ncbi:MAG: YdcF family protein [Phototrophicaceae bacterium]
MLDTDSLVQILWDYMLVGHELRQSDCIFVLGSYDVRVAEYAIDLYKQGYAPYLLFSGGVTPQNDTVNVFWDETEAHYFARLAIAQGVPADKVIIENKATNTSENFSCTQSLLDELGYDFKTFICVQKPFMERRVLAKGLKSWQESQFVVTSPPISCTEYLNGDLPKDGLIQYIVGDFQRVKVYGDNGFQVPQSIPDFVWNAFEQLVARGYDKHLAKP